MDLKKKDWVIKRVRDKPVRTTQRFEVSVEGVGLIYVTRKKVVRQAYDTVCQEADETVTYDMVRGVEPFLQEKVIDSIEDLIDKDAIPN